MLLYSHSRSLSLFVWLDIAYVFDNDIYNFLDAKYLPGETSDPNVTSKQ